MNNRAMPRPRPVEEREQGESRHRPRGLVDPDLQGEAGEDRTEDRQGLGQADRTGVGRRSLDGGL
jgi:hypothetical protein